ncbi:hypothetical protein [Saccharothrix deserti]|uniref:hypothetical protein n=1 Tax=Saccharothrix deserti TaxID=2593674 RepID=UPI00131BE781|nr:hypothetical protein [Saccharothrix deserti]
MVGELVQRSRVPGQAEAPVTEVDVVQLELASFSVERRGWRARARMSRSAGVVTAATAWLTSSLGSGWITA